MTSQSPAIVSNNSLNPTKEEWELDMQETLELAKRDGLNCLKELVLKREKIKDAIHSNVMVFARRLALSQDARQQVPLIAANQPLSVVLSKVNEAHQESLLELYRAVLPMNSKAKRIAGALVFYLKKPSGETFATAHERAGRLMEECKSHGEEANRHYQITKKLSQQFTIALGCYVTEVTESKNHLKESLKDYEDNIKQIETQLNLSLSDAARLEDGVQAQEEQIQQQEELTAIGTEKEKVARLNAELDQAKLRMKERKDEIRLLEQALQEKRQELRRTHESAEDQAEFDAIHALMVINLKLAAALLGLDLLVLQFERASATVADVIGRLEDCVDPDSSEVAELFKDIIKVCYELYVRTDFTSKAIEESQEIIGHTSEKLAVEVPRAFEREAERMRSGCKELTVGMQMLSLTN